MKKLLKNIAFGAIIGASILVPGMSGGTTALILGIYSRIIAAIDELFSDFKKEFPVSSDINGRCGSRVLRMFVSYKIYS